MNNAARTTEAARILTIAARLAIHNGGTVQTQISQAYEQWRNEWFNYRMQFAFGDYSKETAEVHAEMDEMRAVMAVLGFTL